ncbi:unnamed protein product [Amaranthus hypochondriacus]
MISSERERRAGWGFLGFPKNFFRDSNSNFQYGRRRSTARYCYNGLSWYGQQHFPADYGGLRGGSRLHRWCGPQFQKARRCHAHLSPHTHTLHQPSFHCSCCGFWVGHRGSTRSPWRRGPREPPDASGRYVSSLFVDGLPLNISREWLGDLFSEVGKVVDVFLSKKTRKINKDKFGFVRFENEGMSLAAIDRFNGYPINGQNIRVSLARYDRNGVKLSCPGQLGNTPIRVSRKFSKVVAGVRNATVEEKTNGIEIPATVGKHAINVHDADAINSTIEVSSNSKSTTVGKDDVLEKQTSLGSNQHRTPIKRKLALMETMPNKCGSSSNVSQTVKVGGLMEAQFVESTPVECDPKPTAQYNECVKKIFGTVCLDVSSNDADIVKASATPEKIKPVAMKDVGRKQPCRPGYSRKLMNSRDIRNFLGYYGPTKV